MTTVPDSAAPSVGVKAAPPLIGFWTCTALVIGNTIGIGIFMMPAKLAPFGLNALTGWVVTALGCAILAGVYARLARDFANPDGPYGWIRNTQGETSAFLAAWCYWVSLWITNATLAVGVVGYLQAALPALEGAAPAPAIALGLLWLFVVINLFGVHSSGPVQIVTTVLKLLPMAAVIALGLWLLVSEPDIYVRNLPATPLSAPLTMAASTAALFAMLGLESAAVPASRVRDPARTIPRATLIGTLLTAAIYIAVSIVPMLLMPQNELAQSQAPFADLLNRVLGEGVGRWLALFVVVSGLGALNGWTLLTGELTRTMAANGVLPSIFARDNARGSAALALIVTGLLASAMVLMNYSRSLVQGFAFLSQIVTAANLPLYLLSSSALAILAWRGRQRVPRGLIALGLFGAVYSVFAFVSVGLEAFLWGLVLAGAGAPIYAIMRLSRLKARPDPA
jgi:APA family basic amino acid/polyamine antiporter